MNYELTTDIASGNINYLGRDSREGGEQVYGRSAVGGDGGGKDGERVVGGAARGGLEPGEDEHVHDGERDLHRLGLRPAPEAERAVHEQLHQRARAHPRGRQRQVPHHQGTNPGRMRARDGDGGGGAGDIAAAGVGGPGRGRRTIEGPFSFQTKIFF